MSDAINWDYSRPGFNTTAATNALLLALLNGISGSGGVASGLGRYTVSQRPEPIAQTINPGKDGVLLDNYVGCIILGIRAKSASTGEWLDVTTSTGYLPLGVNDLDNVLLASDFTAGLGTAPFNYDFSLTGVGSAVEWTAGDFDPAAGVIVIYFNNLAFIQQSNSVNMISFTTIANQTTYNLGSALSGMTVAWVVYGSQIIPAADCTIVGNSLTISVGGAVTGGLQCYVVPFT